MKALFQRRGEAAEALAARFLRAEGFEVLERNFRCRLGEIDLIAVQGETLHFIEVKGRWTHRKGGPLEQITPRKMKQISKVAAYYLKKYPLQAEQRASFSVLGIDGRADPLEIIWVPAAFETAW